MPRGSSTNVLCGGRKLFKRSDRLVLLDNASKLKITFKFDNFKDSMQFAQHVGQLLEAEGHHPDLTIGWGYGRDEFQMHKISGLHYLSWRLKPMNWLNPIVR